MYREQVVQIMPLQSMQHLTDVELYLRHLFRTDPKASCHALNTASYVTFRNQCLRCLNSGHWQCFTASLLDGYRLEYVDGTVVVKRLTFVVSEDASHSEADVDI